MHKLLVVIGDCISVSNGQIAVDILLAEFLCTYFEMLSVVIKKTLW